eukprot:CAMPEP_0184401976 /NCGR_PEP_ID=MMETSP0007-20130409/81121_1 /TAXON_ID=97485 /ORGANISM="Prymnesium parvum, Strain Texoma1" /LENGTH=70 /DNA_ID=CAMNT_0026757583 /DNA_START=27 /DNA_END=239 /DNA_ORIENTATION=-
MTRTVLTCPSCSSTCDNKVHGYLKARRVFSFPEDYFVMARRHMCKACYAARLLERAEILREHVQKLKKNK